MSNKKNKNLLLLSFIFSPNIGGVETHLDDLCEFLTRKGIVVTVVTYKPIIGNIKAPFKTKQKNIIIYRIPWIKWNLFNRLIEHPLLQILYLTPGILFFSIFLLLNNSRKIDIIQTHGFNMAIVGFILSSIFKKEFTVNTHVSFKFKKINLYTKMLSQILNKSKSVLVLTEDSKNELVKIGVNKLKIAIYHYWIDASFKPMDKTKARANLNLPQNKFVLLFIGRFIKEKGVILLINAMKKKPKNTLLVMIGMGPLEVRMREMIKSLSNVKIFNSISRDKFPMWYSAADATVIPSFNASKIYSEGIPRVMIESFSCSTPVVATRSGGLNYVLDPSTSFFIKPNSKSILKKIDEISKQKRKLILMGESALLKSRSIFSKQKNANIIYKSIVS